MESEDDSVSVSRNEEWLLDCLPSRVAVQECVHMRVEEGCVQYDSVFHF